METRNDLKVSSLLKEIKTYDRVSMLINRKVEILKDKDKENVDNNSGNKVHLRIVAYKDLLEHISSIESTHIDNHFLNGLPKSIDRNAVISIIYPKDFMNKKLHFHEFEKLNGENKTHVLKKSDYDITQYIHNASHGFSLWMTIDETKCVEKYKKTKTKTKTKNEVKTAKPRKEHNFCQICNMYFNDYEEVK